MRAMLVARGLSSCARAQSGMRSQSFNQGAAEASLGARQSPRGESEPPEETFGPFGTAERLNWLVSKKRRMKTWKISDRTSR